MDGAKGCQTNKRPLTSCQDDSASEFVDFDSAHDCSQVRRDLAGASSTRSGEVSDHESPREFVYQPVAQQRAPDIGLEFHMRGKVHASIISIISSRFLTIRLSRANAKKIA
ncbi:hypothetical protein NDU88_005427 [Pleurodeles waltl]|uniref:Uncharacterized protein n=1 Tax=Pleurodeles waltl TaxID=8319 RepID=A0AAV7QFX1_PLEWA|nr:hypothetical protein NDU88_005427 [Pleurodeles waltl]